jgi:hypothetical protein
MIPRQATACAMEVSSHALDQRRAEGLSFRAGVLTNLASDHLDYHRTPDAYFEAKARLFSSLAPDAVAVLNRDDPAFARFAGRSRGRVLSYGLTAGADVRARDVALKADGTRFTLDAPDGRGLAVATPLVETLILAATSSLLLRFLRAEYAIILSSLGWGIAHSYQAPIWGLVIFWPFLIFTTLYVVWKQRSVMAGILMAWAAHFLHNLLSSVAIAFPGVLPGF